MVLLILYWAEYKAAVEEDRLRRKVAAAAHGVGVESFQSWLSSKRPVGLQPPYHNRPMKVKKGKRKWRGRNLVVEPWEQ